MFMYKNALKTLTLIVGVEFIDCFPIAAFVEDLEL